MKITKQTQNKPLGMQITMNDEPQARELLGLSRTKYRINLLNVV